MSHCHSCGGVIGRDCWNPQECAEITERMAIEKSQPDPAPSNANTSGLEVVAWEYRYPDTEPWHKTMSKREADEEREDGSEVHPYAVTAASAQARIAELEAELEEARTIDAGFWKWLGERDLQPDGPDVEWGDIVVALTEHEDNAYGIADKANDRATAAEARADRLAKDAKGLLAEIASFGRGFMAAQASLDSTSTPDAYDDAILAASVRYQSMVKTASALYRAALQQETQP